MKIGFESGIFRLNARAILFEKLLRLASVDIRIKTRLEVSPINYVDSLLGR